MSKRKRFVIIVLFFLLIYNFTLSSNVLSANSNIIEETVYIGGFPIAIVLKIDGVMVDKNHDNFQKGDIIQAINGKKILYSSDIYDCLQDFCEEDYNINIEFLRKNKNMSAKLKLKHSAGNIDFGVSVIEEISGIGMVTYIKENGEFVSLGHKITDFYGENIPFVSGKVYKCEIVGIKKSSRNNPGEIRGIIKGNSIGEIYKNTSYGVSGIFYDVPKTEKYQLAGRNEVVPGKSTIYSTIRQQIIVINSEIIKPLGQIIKSNKSMLIRITDKNFLNQTGGILQGMSGSPIVQDGNLVGAVTHVFINDPTRGFGISIGNMLNN